MDENVMVKGETRLRLSLRRTSKGLKFTVKADPMLEELISGWANATSESVSSWGRLWQGEEALRVYLVPESVNRMESGIGPYSLSHVSQEILLSNGMLNMSWLRLVGIGSGVTFTVGGVYSLKQVQEIAEKIKAVIRSFYMDYLLPVTVHLTMSTEETRG